MIQKIIQELRRIENIKNPLFRLNELDKLDNELLKIIKKRTKFVDLVIKNKKFKKDIVDKKRISLILKNISNNLRFLNRPATRYYYYYYY